MSKKAIGLLLCIIIVVCAYIFGSERGKTWAYRHIDIQVDTLLIYDSIWVSEPVKVTEWKTRVEYVPVRDAASLDSLQCVADSLCRACDLLTIRNDSLMLALEITTAHYHQDSLYDAWVSGWHPSLDSIRVYQQERLVIQRVTEYKPLRWSVGITAGVGACKDGLSPFVGVGLTYALTSF